jgi:hypothetical protein
MMYCFDTDRHYLPSFHINYRKFTCMISLLDSELLEGDLPKNKLRLVGAWIELHKDKLLPNWEIAKNGVNLFDIKPLQ